MRKLVREAIVRGQGDVSLAINPAFSALAATLVDGVEGEVRVRFTAGPDSLQDNGVVSGGVLAAMLDGGTAIAALSMLDEGQNCATVSLTVNMLRLALPGHLEVRAKVDRMGRSMVFVSAQLFDEAERLVATASASLTVINPL